MCTVFFFIDCEKDFAFGAQGSVDFEIDCKYQIYISLNQELSSNWLLRPILLYIFIIYESFSAFNNVIGFYLTSTK